MQTVCAVPTTGMLLHVRIQYTMSCYVSPKITVLALIYSSDVIPYANNGKDERTILTALSTRGRQRHLSCTSNSVYCGLPTSAPRRGRRDQHTSLTTAGQLLLIGWVNLAAVGSLSVGR